MAHTKVVIKDGKVTMDVVGASGKGCLDLTRPYLEAVSGDMKDVKIEEKPEIHQSGEQQLWA